MADTKSIVDEALTEHTATLVDAAQKAKNEFEASRSQLASQIELHKTTESQAKQAQDDARIVLESINSQRNELEGKALQISNLEAELAKEKDSISATTNNLIMREEAVKTGEDELKGREAKLDEQRGQVIADASKVQEEQGRLITERATFEDEKTAQEAKKQELLDLEKRINDLSAEVSKKNDDMDAKATELSDREAKLTQQESINADLQKMFATKKDQLISIETGLMTRQKDLDDREKGLAAQKVDLDKREAELKAKAS